MEKYRITFKKSVAKDLRVIPKNDIKKILNKIDTIAVNPRGEGCINLQGRKIIEFAKGCIE